MSFTNDLTSPVGQIRYAIGDDTEYAGVLPGGGNLSDEQIALELSFVNSVVYAAAARICNNLARRWAVAPQSFTADGLSINRGDVSARWVAQAKEFEIQAAGGAISTVVLVREDGWSKFLGTTGSDLDRV